MSSRRSRHEEHEEHENHERWLVTYADMVTLLMVLFIVMFAISQVDQKKFAELRDGLAAGFGSQDSILTGAESINTEPGAQAVAPQLQLESLTGEEKTLVLQAIDQNARLQQDRVEADAKNELRRLDQVRKQLEKALRKAGLDADVDTSYDDRGLVISLVSRHVTFENDLASLTERGTAIVDKVGEVLAGVPDPIEVDGHTNQAPGKPKYYDSDWALSAARALTVLARLQHTAGLPADRLSLAAFGHTKPLVDPDEPGSQEVNKRVDIVVRARTDHESSALLPGLDAARHGKPADPEDPLTPSLDDEHTDPGTDHALPPTETDLPGGTR